METDARVADLGVQIKRLIDESGVSADEGRAAMRIASELRFVNELAEVGARAAAASAAAPADPQAA